MLGLTLHDIIVIGIVFIAKWTFDAAVGALEAPDATSSKQYRYWFKFLNLLAANVDRSKLWNRLPFGDEDKK